MVARPISGAAEGAESSSKPSGSVKERVPEIKGAVARESGVLRGFTFRAALLGLGFAALSACLNTYLGINFGMGFGFGVIAIMVAYTIFQKMLGGSSKREIAIAYIIGTSALTAHWALGLSIYMVQTYGDVSLPRWLVAPKQDIVSGLVSARSWFYPVVVLFALQLACTGVGLMFSVLLGSEFAKSEKMVFPSTAASSSLIDAVFKGGGAARLVGLTAAAGLGVTTVQYLAKILGADLTSVNLTRFLPKGAVLAIALSLAFVAIGYFISASVSISFLASGLINYLILAPYLVSRGIVDYSGDLNQYYNNILFGFSLSPSLGMLILGGFSLSLLLFVKKKLGNRAHQEQNEGGDSENSVGYGHLYRTLWSKMLSDKRRLALFSAFLVFLVSVAYYLNPFYPMPRWFSAVFVAYGAFLSTFIEFVILTKMAGEMGMTMGMVGIVLYDMPIFAAGYRNYPGYVAGSYYRPNPWTGTSVCALMKYRDRLSVRTRDIVKAKLIGWLPTFAISAIFTLSLWKYLGFGNEQMPAIGLLQQSVYIRMLATGDVRGTVNPLLFVGGGVTGALMELFTPISMMGAAMGMLMPPSYIIPIGLGGIIRLYTDRKYGKKFFKDKGMLVASGVLATSIMVQVVMAILISVLEL